MSDGTCSTADVAAGMARGGPVHRCCPLVYSRPWAVSTGRPNAHARARVPRAAAVDKWTVDSSSREEPT